MQNSYSNSVRKTADRSWHIILNKRLLKLLFITTLLVSASGFNGMAQSVFNVTGTGSYCASANPEGIAVGLDNSEADVTYTISPGGETVLGTGSAISFGNRTEGTYTIAVGEVAMNGNAVITKNDEPVAKIPLSMTSVNVGTAYDFPGVTATGGSILWTMSGSGSGTFTGETTQNPSYLPSGSGVKTFILTVTSAGCGFAKDTLILYCLMADPITWTGATSADWFTETNWFPEGIPDAFTNVTIPAIGVSRYPEITAGAACNNITLENGASILGNENLAVSGTSTIELSLSKGTWHFIAAPNNSTLSGSFTGDYLQTWDEKTAKWLYITATDAQLVPAKGYSLWSKGSGIASYTFNGEFLSGGYSQEITKTTNKSGNEGSNLLGNPYPSYLDWETLKAYGAVYYWNGIGYDAYNGGNGKGSRYVAPMQGFFIIAGANGSFNLTEANRVNIAGGKFYKSAKAINSNTLVLQTLGESYSDKLYIGINPGTTEGFDLQNDAYKLLAYTDGVSELYSYTGDKKLSIDVRPAAQVIQLGFTNTRSGEYQLGLQDIADIPVAMLEDTKTNTFHDLQAGAYSFSYTAGESDKRFLLHLGVSATPENTKSETTVYSNLNTVYIQIKGQMQGNITIYNIAGQQVASRPAAPGLNEIKIQQAGNYIVKVITGKNTVVKKVYVQ